MRMALTRKAVVMVVMMSAMMMIVTSAAAIVAEEAGCMKVVGPLQPCLEYLRGKAKKPSKGCCDGAKELNANAKTTKQKKEACKCLKEAMTKLKNIDVKRIPEIPQKCNITTSLPPIGPDFDCSTIKSQTTY